MLDMDYEPRTYILTRGWLGLTRVENCGGGYLALRRACDGGSEPAANDWPWPLAQGGQRELSSPGAVHPLRVNP